MNTRPLDNEEVQRFLEALDEAGEKLRELIDADSPGDSPAIQYYLDGSVFLESGYLMVEQLSEKFPAIFRALHDEAYWPLFLKTQRGQISWGEALDGLPQLLREYASEKVHEDLFAGEGEG
jgi:hypothetical protein